MKLRLSVVGLGKLGVPMLAVFAGKGFDVVGAAAARQEDPHFYGRSPSLAR
jgi:UDP-N-acetyl-D-mannosaminuronate dehydrogenase